MPETRAEFVSKLAGRRCGSRGVGFVGFVGVGGVVVVVVKDVWMRQRKRIGRYCGGCRGCGRCLYCTVLEKMGRRQMGGNLGAAVGQGMGGDQRLASTTVTVGSFKAHGSRAWWLVDGAQKRKERVAAERGKKCSQQYQK